MSASSPISDESDSQTTTVKRKFDELWEIVRDDRDMTSLAFEHFKTLVRQEYPDLVPQLQDYNLPLSVVYSKKKKSSADPYLELKVVTYVHSANE
jgi:hypothetical protein